MDNLDVIIRNGSLSDLETLAEIEAICFPKAEAATRESLKDRLETFPGYFWIAEKDGEIIGFLNGPVVDRNTIDDTMYASAKCHDADGKWQALFGINTLPEYRRQGVGAMMLNAAIAKAKSEGRKGCTLACKDHKVSYYNKFGFKSIGISESVKGGVIWNDCVVEF